MRLSNNENLINKSNPVIIGYYHLPGSLSSTVYVEDTITYGKKVYNVPVGTEEDAVDTLLNVYSDYRICKFVY